MSEYVLDHGLEGEAARLALMSRLLDPMHRRHLGDAAVDAFLARCADPEWWTQTIAFTAVWGRRGIGGMGVTGLEPVTPSLSSWCSPN